MEKIRNSLSYRVVEVTFLASTISIILLIIASVFNFYDIRGNESNVIYSIQLALKDNALLYQSPESFPFNISQYAPLYYVVNDCLISLLQIENTEFYTIRILTRLSSIVALIIALIYLKNIFQSVLKIPNRTSLILCFLFLIVSFPWFNISRPDVFVLLFYILSIYHLLLYCANKTSQKHAVFLGVFLFLGIASKLTMGFYFIPFGIYFLVIRDYKLALISSISFLFSLGLFYLLLWLLDYNSTYIIENILDGVNNGYNLSKAMTKSYLTFANYYSVFSIGLILLTIESFIKWKDEREDQTLVFLITLNVFTIALSFLAAVKVGSAINYFNEALLVMIILTIYLLEKHYKSYRKLYLIFLMVFGISITLNHSFKYVPNFVEDKNKKHRMASELENIVNYLQDNLGSNYYYSDNREIAMSLPEKCILFPSDIHNITYQREVYDYTLLEKWVNRGELKYLIVVPHRKQIYGIDIDEKYLLTQKFANYYLYELTSYNNK